MEISVTKFVIWFVIICQEVLFFFNGDTGDTEIPAQSYQFRENILWLTRMEKGKETGGTRKAITLISRI